MCDCPQKPLPTDSPIQPLAVHVRKESFHSFADTERGVLRQEKKFPSSHSKAFNRHNSDLRLFSPVSPKPGSHRSHQGSLRNHGSPSPPAPEMPAIMALGCGLRRGFSAPLWPPQAAGSEHQRLSLKPWCLHLSQHPRPVGDCVLHVEDYVLRSGSPWSPTPTPPTPFTDSRWRWSALGPGLVFL